MKESMEFSDVVTVEGVWLWAADCKECVSCGLQMEQWDTCVWNLNKKTFVLPLQILQILFSKDCVFYLSVFIFVLINVFI